MDERDDHDQVVEKFLEFLARDIEERPDAKEVMDASLLDRVAILVDGVTFDLERQLPANGE